MKNMEKTKSCCVGESKSLSVSYALSPSRLADKPQTRVDHETYIPKEEKSVGMKRNTRQNRNAFITKRLEVA